MERVEKALRWSAVLGVIYLIFNTGLKYYAVGILGCAFILLFMIGVWVYASLFIHEDWYEEKIEGSGFYAISVVYWIVAICSFLITSLITSLCMVWVCVYVEVAMDKGSLLPIPTEEIRKKFIVEREEECNDNYLNLLKEIESTETRLDSLCNELNQP